ncbi:phosphohistidine phosphatase SixA [Paraferrimonas sedimenticola]|uniref:Phosphohistidine phosphatase SixA n=2 Tax=Paraferrimonas sedimenticola TaxID=375674 RepID=A0AA37RWH9_9GAMM|nr:phosphohistidine phosphatase SixA [Paraferrimonas sedimenticola]
MRHGDAAFDACKDSERQLSLQGRREAQKTGQILAGETAQVDLVLVSPYLRAQQTWQLVRYEINPPGKIVVLDELTPESDPALTASLISAMAEVQQAKTVLVVAHMPLLGYLCTEFVAGIEPPLFATAGLAKINGMDNGQLVSMTAPQNAI